MWSIISSTNISPSQDCFLILPIILVLFKLFKKSFPFSLSSSVKFDLYNNSKSVFVRSVSQRDEM